MLSKFAAVFLLFEPDENYDYLETNKYYYNSSLYDTIVLNQIKNSYEIGKYNVIFPSLEEQTKTLNNVGYAHSIKVSQGLYNISAFSYPQSALYKSSVNTIVAQAQTNLQTKTISVEYKKIPLPIISAYIEALKFLENNYKLGRTYIPCEKDENGNIILDESENPIPIYERVQNEYGIYGDFLKPNGPNSRVNVYRWFTHDDGIGFETIGYGHKLLDYEKKLRVITINDKYSVIEIDKNGLSDLDVERLFAFDIKKRIELTQNFIGPARWNWLIDNHPAWAMLLVEKQYNGGTFGLRSWPKLLYCMGLTDSENYFANLNLTQKEKSALLGKKLKYNYIKLTSKRKDGSFIFEDFKNIPFTPKNQVYLNNDDIFFQSKLQEIQGMGGFVIRNTINGQLFIYLSGEYFDQYTSKGGTYKK